MKSKINSYLTLLSLVSVLLVSCKKDQEELPSELNLTNDKTTAVFNTSVTYGQLTDQDGNTYKTITIGTQTWMAENLRTTKYNDGSIIPNVSDNTSWRNLKSGAFCNYNNTSSLDTIATYGRLYNWYSINTQKLAPVGWHVPNDVEWKQLIDYLGESSSAAIKLKEKGNTHWSNPNTGNNESGFTASGNGGTPQYNYLWSGGSTSNTLNVNTTGTYSVTVTDTKGCKGTALKAITVNPLPNATIDLPSEVCQDGSAELRITGSLGTEPYSFTYNGSSYNSNNGEYFVSSIPTALPRIYSYNLTRVTDSKGCSRDLQIQKNIQVWKNPDSSIDFIARGPNFPTQVGQDFDLDATPSIDNEHPIFNYRWTFDPQMKLNQSLVSELSQKSISAISANQNGQHTFKLSVTDSKNCQNEIIEFKTFGNSTGCRIESEVSSICVNSSIFEDTVKLIYIPSTGGGNNGLASITYECLGCDTIMVNGQRDLNPNIKVSSINNTKTVRIRAFIKEANAAGCDGMKPTDYITINFVPLFIMNNQFPQGLDLCVEEQKKLDLDVLAPTSNRRIFYSIKNNNNEEKKNTTLDQNKISLDLSSQIAGEYQVSLDSVQSTVNNEVCNSALQGLNFSYTVTECRQPTLSVQPTKAQDTFCLNQSGISFTAVDKNNYRGFLPISKSYGWQILDSQNNVLSSNSPIVEPRDSSVVIFLEDDKFQNTSFVKLRSIISSNYQGIPAFKAFKDTADYEIIIANSKIAPDRSTIARYPGHVYFLEDTSDVCVQWGLADALTDGSLDTSSEMMLNKTTNPRVSDSSFAVFGNEILTTDLQTKVGDGYEKYLWADTWFKTGATCNFDPLNCITRTYYNASLPPKGAPRSTPDTYQAVIYPNPTTGQFTVALQGDWADTFTIDLLDYTGRLVRHLDVINKTQYKAEQPVDVQDTQPGMYLLRVTNSDGWSKIHKVIVQ